MTTPDTIPVAYEEGYYTTHIGRCADGAQFMAFVVATLPTPLPADWKRHKRLYAVLHTFEPSGEHRSTEAWLAGVTGQGEASACDRAAARRDEMVAALGRVELCDVRVKLFSVRVDGHEFGLVDTSDARLGPRVTLVPNDLSFHPPWDGTFEV